MVAYSFKKRFVPLIESGAKTQTIRGDRARHALVGEPVQLFYGMRTKHCRKIIPDPICKYVGKITLSFATGHVRLLGPKDGGHFSLRVMFGSALDRFARSDGFDDWQDLCAFWETEHGLTDVFTGTLIKWEPQHG